MIRVRKSEDRGHADHGWLSSRHSFSFADYHDPAHMGFRSLRVINEDRVAPGRGFGTHGHRNMEILSYVLSGSLAHKDSMGHEEVLGPNEIQRMSAGTGITHSEYNPSPVTPVHFLQIWLEPATAGTRPGYEQIRFEAEEKQGRLRQLAGPDGGPGIARINQDARVFVAELADGRQVVHPFAANRHGWLHVIRGAATVNGTLLQQGDAAAISGEERIEVTGSGSGNGASGEILLFDLA